MSATSQILTDVAEALASGRHDVTVYASRMSYDGQSKYENGETINGVFVRRIWTTRFGRGNALGRSIDYLTFYLTTLVSLLFRLRRTDTIIAKTDPPLLSIPVGVITRLKRARLINWLQDIFPEVANELGVSSSNSPIISALIYLRNRSLKRANANVVIGTKMAETVAGFGVLPKHVHIISNFVDDQAIMARKNYTPSLRQEWGISSEDFVVGYSGNLGRAHDLDTVIGAAKILKKNKTIKFLFVGGGYLHERLTAEIKQHELSNVLLRPYQPRERLPESLSLPNMHWASLNPNLEGYIVPSKIYGVAAAGRPLLMIGDEDGEIGGLVSKFQFGKCIAPGDVEAAENYIIELQNSPEEVTSLNSNARKFIDSHASMQHAFTRWNKLLDAILAGD